jgi:AraC-like DNA-binding protein
MQSVRRLFERARRGIQFQGRSAREAAERLVRLPQATGAMRIAEFVGILALLAAVRDRRLLSGEGFLDLPENTVTARIRRACRYVFEHIGDEVRLVAVAREAALSPEAFCRSFRRVTGRRFFDFVNELRVSHACALLKDTDRAIGEIAAASGFETLANFNRRFRERKECAPRDFRRRFRQ